MQGWWRAQVRVAYVCVGVCWYVDEAMNNSNPALKSAYVSSVVVIIKS